MIREIVHDPIFLAQQSADATKEDLQTGIDMVDTLKAHEHECVGMAANMIGVLKRIIVFDDEGKAGLMFNPEIIKCSGPYQTEEGCLSLAGTRKTKRYKSIKVRYMDGQFRERIKTYTGWTAEIIQHEIDHCNGILI